MIDLSTNSELFVHDQKKNIIRYNDYLDKLPIKYEETDYHLHIITPFENVKWILYIAINTSDFIANQYEILSTLATISAPFKIIKNSNLHFKLNCGELGNINIGKAISVTFETDAQVSQNIPLLQHLTKAWWGPRVKNSLKLGPCLYGQYSSSTPSTKEYIHLSTARFFSKTEFQHYDSSLINEDIKKKTEIIFVPFAKDPYNGINKINNISGKYHLGEMLRSELGGAYYKANTKDGNDPRIIRIGYKGSQMDEVGNDITDKIRWQFDAIKRFSLNNLGIPFSDFTEYQDKAFLIMNCQSGNLMAQVTQKILNGRPWADLDKNEKCKLLGYWINLIDIIDKFHENNIIINNINQLDVYIDDTQNISFINWDCLCSANEPNRFNIFHPEKKGFISPQQISGYPPTFKDDIFSFGALILSSSNNIPIYRLWDTNTNNFTKKLELIINHPSLENLISICLSRNSNDRPSPSEIKTKLVLIKSEVLSKKEKQRAPEPRINEIVRATIGEGIKGLDTDTMTSEGRWFAEAPEASSEEIFDKNKKQVYHGLYKGIEGIMYFLCKALNFDWDLMHLSEKVKMSIEFIDKIDPSNFIKMGSGLYNGSSGIALSLREIIFSGLIENGSNFTETIKQCFPSQNPETNVLHGIAGEGLAILHLADVPESNDFHKLLIERIDTLLQLQSPDGSWKNSANKSSEHVHSFGYGTAGILYFLLEAGHRHNIDKCIKASENGIDYLSKTYCNTLIKSNTDINSPNKQNNTGWCSGTAGIALTFIKAYKVTGLKECLLMAETLLRSIPIRLFSKNLGQCHGLSGLGEIYLEMYETTGSSEWWKRASSIAQIICTLKIFDKSNGIYWLSENSDFPTAGFMTGNTGIMHFLLRYLNPNKIRFPFL